VNLLIVEDNRHMRRMLGKLLRNHQTRVAQDATSVAGAAGYVFKDDDVFF
jgi:hypothetical protein